jgi:hypothetical protein
MRTRNALMSQKTACGLKWRSPSQSVPDSCFEQTGSTLAVRPQCGAWFGADANTFLD